MLKKAPIFQQKDTLGGRWPVDRLHEGVLLRNWLRCEPRVAAGDDTFAHAPAGPPPPGPSVAMPVGLASIAPDVTGIGVGDLVRVILTCTAEAFERVVAIRYSKKLAPIGRVR